MKGSPATMSEEALIAEILPAERPNAAQGKRRILREAYKEMVPLAGIEQRYCALSLFLIFSEGSVRAGIALYYLILSAINLYHRSATAKVD